MATLLESITLDDLLVSSDEKIREFAQRITKEYSDYEYAGCPHPTRTDGLPLVLEREVPTPSH